MEFNKAEILSILSKNRKDYEGFEGWGFNTIQNFTDSNRDICAYGVVSVVDREDEEAPFIIGDERFRYFYPVKISDSRKVELANLIDLDGHWAEEITDSFGSFSQLHKAIEEMSELIKELCKILSDEHYENPTNVVEEMADVEIMLKQLRYIFDCDFAVDTIKRIKIARTLKKINKDGLNDRINS